MALRVGLANTREMRKTFSLQHPRKAPARVLDSIKHDVRNYVQRERRKPLPEGAARWDFRCKIGTTSATAEEVALKQVSSALDGVANTGVTEIFLEIIAVPSGASDTARLPRSASAPRRASS